MSPQARETKHTNVITSNQKALHSKGNISKTKRQPTEWEKKVVNMVHIQNINAYNSTTKNPNDLI